RSTRWTVSTYVGRFSGGSTWNTPRSTIRSTRFAPNFDFKMSSTRNSMERPAAFADALAFLIALGEMSVPTTSKPRFARFLAWVAGPVPRSRILLPLRAWSFRDRSRSASRFGVYQGRVETSEVAYSPSHHVVGCDTRFPCRWSPI